MVEIANKADRPLNNGGWRPNSIQGYYPVSLDGDLRDLILRFDENVRALRAYLKDGCEWSLTSCAIEALSHRASLFRLHSEPIASDARELYSPKELDLRENSYFTALDVMLTCPSLDIDTLNSINGILQKGDGLSQLPSTPRTTQNWIGTREGGTKSARYLPPPADIAKAARDAFLTRYASATPVLHPIVSAAMCYVDFVNTHPYYDGNGRTALLLTTVLLARQSRVNVVFPLSRFLYAKLRERVDILYRFEHDPAAWIGFVARAALYSARRIRRVLPMLVNHRIKDPSEFSKWRGELRLSVAMGKLTSPLSHGTIFEIYSA